MAARQNKMGDPQFQRDLKELFPENYNATMAQRGKIDAIEKEEISENRKRFLIRSGIVLVMLTGVIIAGMVIINNIEFSSSAPPGGPVATGNSKNDAKSAGTNLSDSAGDFFGKLGEAKKQADDFFGSFGKGGGTFDTSVKRN